MSELLKINNVTRSFNGRKVLDGLSLSVGTGKIVGLLAPNGVGKTTLFRHITGLLTQDSGEILVDGKKISKETNALVSYLPDYFEGRKRTSAAGAVPEQKSKALSPR